MRRFVVRQLIWAFILMYVGSFIVVWLSHAAGNPAAIIAGPRASPEVIENVAEAYGLNDPIIVQHSRYMWNFVQGDLGESLKIFRGQPVWDLLKPRMAISFQLGIASLLAAYSIGLPLGVLLAVSHIDWIGPFRRKTRRVMDSFVVGSSLALRSIPTLILMPLLIYFLVTRAGLFPPSGWDGLFSTRAVIPFISLASGGFVGVALLVRTTMLSNIEKPFVETLRAKGLSSRRIVWHIFRNSLLPVVTGLQSVLTIIVGGSFFVELLYGIPGMQLMLIDALRKLDMMIYLPVILIQVLLFIIGRTAVDVAYTRLDPTITIDGG